MLDHQHDATDPVSTTHVIGTQRKQGAASCRGAHVVEIHVHTRTETSRALNLGEVRTVLECTVL